MAEDDFDAIVRAQLARFGIEVDAVDLQVIRAVEAVYGPLRDALLAADLSEVEPENDLDPSRAPSGTPLRNGGRGAVGAPAAGSPSAEPAPAGDHPQDLPLREQARLVAGGEIDPSELLDATFERIEERDGPLNSIVDRFAAEAAEMLSNAPRGPLHGVPVGMKDEFALPWRAPRDGALRNPYGIGAGESGVFRRIRDSGAVVVGATHMHELGIGSTGHLSIYGPCANPWDPSRCAGGSSGGSAAAVAARLVGGAIGADGGGSIRYPAAYCGVTGLKLTWGGVPTDGFLHGFLSLGTAGPICRDAADTRLLAEALLGSSLPPAGASSIRLGIPRTQLWSDLDPEVEQSCRGAVEALGGAGAEIREVTIEGAEHAAIATVLPLSLEGVPEGKPAMLAEIEPRLSPVVRGLTKYQLLVPAAALVKAGRLRALVRRSLASLFADVDVLAWPAVPAPAPPIADPRVRLPSGEVPADYANVRLGGIANLAGTPALSLPCGHTANGLPIGLQLLAPWGEDARLLDVAELLEQMTDRRYVDAVPPIAQRTAA
jgi:aspartyl-tRNA(Asn)/glutamyl-tRNA(Gln) amidotransferase subunit A